MSLTQAEPAEFFSNANLVESELLRFRMKPSLSQLDIVVIYTAELLSNYFQYLHEGGPPGAYRCKEIDFRLIRFSGVGEIRTPRSIRPEGSSDHDWEAYEKRLLHIQHLITDVTFRQQRESYQCTMCFDSCGVHRWSFHALGVARRVASILRRDSSIEYYDKITGTAIDPKNPFTGEMDGT